MWTPPKRGRRFCECLLVFAPGFASQIARNPEIGRGRSRDGLRERLQSMKLRMIFALLLLVGLVYFVGGSQMIEVLREVDFRYVLALLGISVVLIWLSCIKWRLFIRAWGHDASILHLMRIYTITYFYNVFAPSFLMGDLARSYHLGKKLDNQKDAFIATFLERVTGLLAMVLLGTIFVALGAKAAAGVELAILAVAFLTILGAFVCFSKRAYQFASNLAIRILRRLPFKKLTAKVEKLQGEVGKAVDVARANEMLFAKAMFWSVCFHFGTVINTYTAARAIGWDDPDFGGLCIVVPLVLLVAIAPITPSGIGIQEGAFMFFLQRVGATQPESLAVGLILRAKNMITALVGWALWATMKKPEPENAVEKATLQPAEDGI